MNNPAQKPKQRQQRRGQPARFRSVTFLGTSSAQPIPMKRNVSSMVIQNTSGSLYMIDCGEATQHQLKLSTLRISKLHSIFITHCHGDHCYGLFGLLHSLPRTDNNEETSQTQTEKPKTKPKTKDNMLHIYGPIGIKKMIETVLQVSGGWQHYPIQIHELQLPSNLEKMQMMENENYKQNNPTQNTQNEIKKTTHNTENETQTTSMKSMEIDSDCSDSIHNNNSNDFPRKMSFDNDDTDDTDNNNNKTTTDNLFENSGNFEEENIYDTQTQCHTIHAPSDSINGFFYQTKNNQCFEQETNPNSNIIYNNNQLKWHGARKYDCNDIIFLGEIENGILAYACPITHRVPTFGYVFIERDSAGKLDAKKAMSLGAKGKQLGMLKNGLNVTLNDNTIINSKDVVGASMKGYKIGVMQDCSDCRSCFEIANHCDLLIHECTYANEFEHLAVKRGHSTAEMAAMSAVNMKAKMLVLTHFSSRYVEETHTLKAIEERMNNEEKASKSGQTIKSSGNNNDNQSNNNDNNNNDDNDNNNIGDLDSESKEDLEDFLSVQELQKEAKLKCIASNHGDCVVRCAADFMTLTKNSKLNRFVVQPKLSIQESKEKHFTHDVQYLRMLCKENEQSENNNNNNSNSNNNGNVTGTTDVKSKSNDDNQNKAAKSLNDENMIDVD